MPKINKIFSILDNIINAYTTTITSTIRYYTECAPMITTLLYLNKCSFLWNSLWLQREQNGIFNGEGDDFL